MNKSPSFQFYPADWRKDPGVQALDYFTRGVWFEILCIMFESEERGRLILNGQRMPDEALARLLGLDNQILTTTLTILLQYGVAKVEKNTGVIYNRRMVEDEHLRQIRRECGSRGGNPQLLRKNKGKILVNQKSTTPVNQIPTPSSSSSIHNTLVPDEIKDLKNNIPAKKIIKAYHDTLPMLPKIKAWTPNRQTLLKARWHEDKERQSIDWWGDLFIYIRDKCPHLIGGNDRGWKADLQWIITQGNLVKIIEGKYERD